MLAPAQFLVTMRLILHFQLRKILILQPQALVTPLPGLSLKMPIVSRKVYKTQALFQTPLQQW